tara:strand:- start:878 stop:1579 length:702 start_codon:yes stop_codon:yes gene_type:complete
MKLYRKEEKYLIKTSELKILKNELIRYMQKDPHSYNGSYKVRSLYFDTIYSDDLMDKLSGEYRKRKFRIRIYNNSDNHIKFEKKYRIDNAVYKKSYIINKKMASSIQNNNYGILLNDSNNYKYFKLYYELVSNCYKAKSLVEYDRVALTLPFNNIRITFDSNISYNPSLDIFNPKYNFIPLTFDNYQILEIKYSGPIPDHIKTVLSFSTANRQSISKFSMSQKYNNFNNLSLN